MEKELKINYSIVSRGTEKNSNHGYLAVTEENDNNIHILNIDHGITKSKVDNSLVVKSIYEIENIAFSKFQLVTDIMYIDNHYKIKENILLLGLGNIGITCLFYLLDKKYKNITIYIRKIRPYILDVIDIIKENYDINIKIINDLSNIDEYQTIIDTTGSSDIIKEVIDNMALRRTLIVLSTSIAKKDSISLLSINRKSISIIGSHELYGISQEKRNRRLNKLLVINQKKTFLRKLVNIYKYSPQELKRIKEEKRNFIEIFKYF